MLGMIIPWWGRWLAIALLLLGCMAFGAAKMHAHDQIAYDALEREFADFKAQIAALGAAAKKAAQEHEQADQARKEKADADATKLLADNADLARKLRDARAGGNYLPQPAANSASPDRICFDRTALELAIRQLDASVQGLIEQGDVARLKLSTAAEWAQSLNQQEPIR